MNDDGLGDRAPPVKSDALAKRPYETPRLVVHGRLAMLTAGMNGLSLDANNNTKRH